MSAETLAPNRTEPRWPAIATMLLAVILVTSLPARYQVVAPWFPWAAFVAVVTPMVALGFRPNSRLWHRIERTIVLLFVVSGFSALVLLVKRLVEDMLARKHDIGSVTLLESAAVIWAMNILVFALFYWQLDGAGPEARVVDRRPGPPDFVFGEKEIEEIAHGLGAVLPRLSLPRVRDVDVVHAARLREACEPPGEAVRDDASHPLARDARPRCLTRGRHS